MNPNFLDFEQPIAELEDKLRGLTASGRDNAIDVDDEVGKLRSKLRIKTAEIFRDLTPWQVTQLSRHPAAVDRLSQRARLRRSGTRRGLAGARHHRFAAGAQRAARNPERGANADAAGRHKLTTGDPAIRV